MNNSHFSRMNRVFAVLLTLSLLMVSACAKAEETEAKKKKKIKKESTSITTLAPTDTPTPTPLPTDTPTPTPTPFTSTFQCEAAENYMAGIQFDGTILVAEQDQIVWTYTSGYADRLNKKDNKLDTVYEFGSITKQFTAVAIMQLVEQGKISLDDTLDKYIPEYSHSSEVTIHQLLNMTSGVPDYLGILGFSMEDFENLNIADLFYLEDTLSEIATAPLDQEELVTRISEFPMNFLPGTQFEYSNTNYYFLGMIIEKLSGMNYDEYIRQNILNPLGLKELFPDTDHLTSNGRTDLGMISFDLPHQHDSISYAVGVMTGTAEGLLAWEKCVMDGALLSKESWEKIFDGGLFGYGYGWYIDDGYVDHSGMTLGYNTNVTVDKDRRRVVIVLSNIQPVESTEKRPMSGDIAAQLWTDF